MKPAALSFCGLLVALACSPAFAEPQALITVAPNNFSPGQNISNSTAGARLLALAAVPNPDPNFPGTTIAQYFPVYAQPVAVGCGAFFIPCSLGGSLTLGYSPTTGTFADILWGEENDAVNSGCLIRPNGLFCITDAPVLRVNFDVPTNFVTAAVGVFDDDGSVIEAFDVNGNSIARCIVFPSETMPIDVPSGCAPAIIAQGGIGWFQVTISRPTADISFVLIGGFGNVRPIAQMQFDSPVSLQLARLLTRVKGVGPGKALANDVMFAQTYYSVGDIPSTCVELTDLATTAKSQSGKKINNLTASQLLATAQAIEVALNCKY
jgi:hypothetical protein